MFKLKAYFVNRSYFRNCHRVVEDFFGGYEAQVKYWWFPLRWFQMCDAPYSLNTWRTLELAQDFINNGAKPKQKNKRKVYWVSPNCN